MINAPAPIAPELAYKEEQHSKGRQKELRIAKASNVIPMSSNPFCSWPALGRIKKAYRSFSFLYFQ